MAAGPGQGQGAPWARPGTAGAGPWGLVRQFIIIIGFYWFLGLFGGFLVVFGQKTMVINHGY